MKTFVPIVAVAALLVLSVALGLHCLVLHCDREKRVEVRRRHDRRG